MPISSACRHASAPTAREPRTVNLEPNPSTLSHDCQNLNPEPEDSETLVSQSFYLTSSNLIGNFSAS